MKKRYIQYIVALTLGMQAFSACSDEYLEVKPKGTDLEAGYYRNQQEAYNGLVAVYDMLGYQDGLITKVGVMNSASDDHYAGGGNSGDITAYQVMTNYTVSPAVGPQENLWGKGYSGIFRANVLLSKLPTVPMDENLKKRYAAETKFLRAFFYFDLVRLFKNIPLTTAPISASEIYNVVQATPQEVYQQIETDLKEALAEANLPNTVPIGEGGRITKGAAYALLGKVYLYQNKLADAAAQLAEVNGPTPGQANPKYGYNLLKNFGDLWKSTAAFKYNSESILEIGHTSTSAGTWGCIACTEGNVLNKIIGPRGYTVKTAGAPDYVSGYSFLVVTPSLFNAIHNDPRYKYTVANLDSLEKAGAVNYEKGYMDTGYFLEKFAGRVANQPTGGGDEPLNYPQNMYEIRLADTYLLEAEALLGSNPTRAQQLLDAVRARVGLPSIPVTADALLNERRLELAGEGHRWFDLVRTGKAGEVLASRGFKVGKNEVLPIPLLELENTKLEQNKEYGGTK